MTSTHSTEHALRSDGTNITWLNPPEGNVNGAFISVRAGREAAGNKRLTIYFSSRAAKKLSLSRGERVLVGVDKAQGMLALKPTLFGGNCLKGRERYDNLSVVVAIPSDGPLPAPTSVREDDITIDGDVFTFPYPSHLLINGGAA